MHWSEIWNGRSFRAVAIRTLLTPPSWLYSIGWRCYCGVYSLGLKKAAEPHSPVLCVGGLAVGGSGKSPVALHLADLLGEMGHQVALSCSGYGSTASEAARIAPEGPLEASEWGDEAAMFRWLRPNLSLIVGRRRVLAAQLCHERFPEAVMLMDDGFQHLPLKKHLSILLLDAGHRNFRCLPAGPYREPIAYRSRADLVLPGEFSVAAQPLTLRDASGATAQTPSSQVHVLCALGQPEKFVAALTELGVSIGESRFLPDHDPLTDGYLFKGWAPEETLIVTAKDWVKLRSRTDVADRRILIADHRVTIEPQDAFRAWIQSRLNELTKISQKGV